MGSSTELMEFLKYLDSVADRNSDSSFLTRTIWAPFAFSSIYLTFVLWFGPLFMNNRRPYSIKRLLLCYNILQTVISMLLAYQVVRYRWLWPNFSFVCPPWVNSQTDELSLSIYNLYYYVYLSKILDLCNTVVFVLRKKYTQVTFLHVFYQFMNVHIGWLGVKYFPGGSVMPALCINQFVRVTMYTYYLASSYHLPGSILMRPYVTLSQLGPFLINYIIIIIAPFRAQCDISYGFHMFSLGVDIMFLYLFLKVFIRNYNRQGHKGFALKKY